MAKGKKISELSVAESLSGGELIPFAKNGDNGAATAGVIKEYCNDGMQTQLADSEDIEVDGDKLTLTERAKRALFDEIWIQAGVYYDPGVVAVRKQCSSIDREGHPEAPYILNDIPLTYKEALDVYAHYPTCKAKNTKRYAFARTRVKTLFPIELGENIQGVDITYMCMCCSNLEAVRIGFPFNGGLGAHLYNRASNYRQTFGGSKKLRVVYGEINLEKSSEVEGSWPMFSECTALEDFRLRGVHLDLNLKDCPKVNYDSIQFLIQYATNTSKMTVTVHADVYAKLTDEENEEWNGLLALAAEKNIQFATA